MKRERQQLCIEVRFHSVIPTAENSLVGLSMLIPAQAAHRNEMMSPAVTE